MRRRPPLQHDEAVRHCESVYSPFNLAALAPSNSRLGRPVQLSVLDLGHTEAALLLAAGPFTPYVKQQCLQVSHLSRTRTHGTSQCRHGPSQHPLLPLQAHCSELDFSSVCLLSKEDSGMQCLHGKQKTLETLALQEGTGPCILPAEMLHVYTTLQVFTKSRKAASRPAHGPAFPASSSSQSPVCSLYRLVPLVQSSPWSWRTKSTPFWSRWKPRRLMAVPKR